MSQNQNTNVSTIFRDTAFITVALTALAYFFGYIHLTWYWHFLGLNRGIYPDATVEEILLRGGVCIFTITPIIVGAYFLWDRLKKPEGTKVFSLPSIRIQILLFCIFLTILATGLIAIALAWNRSKKFQNEIAMVQELVLEPGCSIPNNRELAFLGHMGSYIIFKRIDGHDQGEIILVIDSEVKSITMQCKKPTNKNIHINRKIEPNSPISSIK